MVRRITLCFALVSAMSFLQSLSNPVYAGNHDIGAKPNGKVTLTILHDNDLHGHLLPFAYTETGRNNLEKPSVGGAARRATLIRRLRSDIKNPTFLVDSGDIATRGPLTTRYEGIADVDAMNVIGYELAAIGNNEFKLKDGVDRFDSTGAESALLLVIKRSRFPWICANVLDCNGSPLEGVQPYVVRVFDGVRVGFLGLTTSRSQSYPQTRGWKFIDPITAAKEWVPKARKNCDILIAVTHIGVDEDTLLATQTAGIDAIIGGDSHTFLYKPLVLKNAEGKTVPVVQDGEFGVNLGRFDLNLAEDKLGHWQIASFDDKLIAVSADIKEAADVNAVLSPYVLPMGEIAGKLPSIPKNNNDRIKQTTQIIVDALKDRFNADYAFNPSGAGLFGSFRNTVITRYELCEVMPFHNNAVTATLTGDEIQKFIKADPRIVVAGDTTKIDPAKSYKVTLVDFIATSTYNLPEDKIKDTGDDIRDVAFRYLKINYPVSLKDFSIKF